MCTCMVMRTCWDVCWDSLLRCRSSRGVEKRRVVWIPQFSASPRRHLIAAIFKPEWAGDQMKEHRRPVTPGSEHQGTSNKLGKCHLQHLLNVSFKKKNQLPLLLLSPSCLSSETSALGCQAAGECESRIQRKPGCWPPSRHLNVPEWKLDVLSYSHLNTRLKRHRLMV